MDKANIMVLGSGGFGLSLAVMLNGMGHDVTVWSKFRTELDDIRRDGENKAKLPGVKISEKIRLTDDISEAKGKDLIIFGIPVNFVRSVANEVAPYIDEKTVLVNTGKGH
ncbi:MAG: 2-dehydropantoate 2-reductase N-terminal domain-containing protein, partial [Huintestinicola sp.]